MHTAHSNNIAYPTELLQGNSSGEDRAEGSSSSPSSPASSPQPSFTANAVDKELNKIASKSYGYIQRSIELLGRDSSRLAGARDFSNTLHWTQAMKFLKERGYIYTKTGHGTSVAEQFQNLGGLERAFQDQFHLENFPLPRLSKNHMEKLAEAKQPLYEEPTFNSSKPYDYGVFPQFRSFQEVGTKSPGYKPPRVENSILVAPIDSVASKREMAVREPRRSSSDVHKYPVTIPQPMHGSQLSRRLSAPEVPLPHGLPAPTYDHYSNSLALPPLLNLTASLPPAKPTNDTPKCSNIHSLLLSSEEEMAQESLHSMRQKAADALLLHNFVQKASEEPSRKRMPPSSCLDPTKEKRTKIDYNEEGLLGRLAPSVVSNRDR